MLLLKVILLQALWYVAVYYADLYQYSLLVISFVFVILNFILFLKKTDAKTYFLSLIFFILFGVYETMIASQLSLIDYKMDGFPLWLMSLYIVFICYYGDVFNYLKDKNIILLSLLGAIGGAGAFYGGVKISPIEVKDQFYFALIALNWAIFFPVSIKLFYKFYKI